VPHTPGTVLDSGAQVNILEGALGSGTPIQLTVIRGAKTETETADAVFPVIAADGLRHAFSIRGKNIVATRLTDNIRCCSRQGTKSISAWALVLTQMMVTYTRQLSSASLSFPQAISGGFQCGAHHHDVRVLPVRDRSVGRRSCAQRSRNEKSTLQTILAQSRRRRVARPLGNGRVY
jgi:hypothetical protein